MKNLKPKHNDMVHEALDRAHMVSNHLQMALEHHPITLKDAEVKRAYDQAVAAVEELYQLIGAKFER